MGDGRERRSRGGRLAPTEKGQGGPVGVEKDDGGFGREVIGVARVETELGVDEVPRTLNGTEECRGCPLAGEEKPTTEDRLVCLGCRVREVQGQAHRQTEVLGRLDEAIRGNGGAGLSTRVSLIERWVEKAGKLRWAFLMALMALLGGLLLELFKE